MTSDIYAEYVQVQQHDIIVGRIASQSNWGAAWRVTVG